MILSGDLIDLKNNIYNSRNANAFERDFVNNVMSFNITRFIGIENKLMRDVGVNVTYKQEAILEKLIKKYNSEKHDEDIFSRYTNFFKEKGITLDGFDKRHLNTFKGIFNESDNFKKWFSYIGSW